MFVRTRTAESLTEINETGEDQEPQAEAEANDDKEEKVVAGAVTRSKSASPCPSPNPESQAEEQEDNPAPAHEEVAGESGAEEEEEEESFEPPQQAVRVGREEEVVPLNLHQSPAHQPGPSPTHRPTPYHPTIESSQGPPGYYPPYNHPHYFNSGNNNYNGQPGPFMPPGWAAEQHEMYIGRSQPPPPPHDSHHSSHLSHPGLGHLGLNQFGRLPHGQDPYNFPNSDEELCSPGRPGPPPLNMGFSGIPMPLIAPKAQKPRKPRKPRSPKQEGLLSMQMKEDSRR